MVRIIIAGAAGKMGSTILNLALNDKELSVAGVTEAAGHPLIGQDIGYKSSVANHPLIIAGDLTKVIEEGDVVIDFTEPAASLNHFRIARRHNKAIVIGSTGFNDDALDEIRAAKDARVVISPNMSVGMNLMFDVVERISKVLKDGYDTEIVEMHHRWKKDSPSGSAVRLKEAIQRGNPKRDWLEVSGRKGITGGRKDNEIAVMSLRGGDVVGEHTVIFAGIGERLEVTHRAHSRETFAAGALVAAKWLVNQPNGIYTMKDVLGI